MSEKITYLSKHKEGSEEEKTQTFMKALESMLNNSPLLDAEHIYAWEVDNEDGIESLVLSITNADGLDIVVEKGEQIVNYIEKYLSVDKHLQYSASYLPSLETKNAQILFVKKL